MPNPKKAKTPVGKEILKDIYAMEGLNPAVSDAMASAVLESEMLEE